MKKVLNILLVGFIALFASTKSYTLTLPNEAAVKSCAIVTTVASLVPWGFIGAAVAQAFVPTSEKSFSALYNKIALQKDGYQGFDEYLSKSTQESVDKVANIALQQFPSGLPVPHEGIVRGFKHFSVGAMAIAAGVGITYLLATFFWNRYTPENKYNRVIKRLNSLINGIGKNFCIQRWEMSNMGRCEQALKSIYGYDIEYAQRVFLEMESTKQALIDIRKELAEISSLKEGERFKMVPPQVIKKIGEEWEVLRQKDDEAKGYLGILTYNINLYKTYLFKKSKN